MMEALQSRKMQANESFKPVESAWSRLINEFRDMGAEVGPGPWSDHVDDDNDHSVIIKYSNDRYGTFLIWLIDRADGFNGDKRRDVWSCSWLIPSGSGRGGERGLTDRSGHPFDTTITAQELIDRLQTIADTDPYTGKNVGWQNMHHVGFAGFASDESIDRARREQEYPGWYD
jgi:hypothetical protein